MGIRITNSTSRFSNMGLHGKDRMESKDDYVKNVHMADYTRTFLLSTTVSTEIPSFARSALLGLVMNNTGVGDIHVDFRLKGANLEYNDLKGEIGCKVHDPSLAMATMEIVEQQWRKLANSLIVGKNDSENQMVTASMIFTPDDKVKAPLVDFLGRISEFGVLAKGLMSNRSKNCPRISPVDLFVMVSSSTLFVASWFPP